MREGDVEDGYKRNKKADEDHSALGSCHIEVAESTQ